VHRFRSPYRCKDCGARFWVISRRARLAGVFLGAALLLVLTPIVLYWHAVRTAQQDDVINAQKGEAEALSLDDVVLRQIEVRPMK
jgi:hypothetical protein